MKLKIVSYNILADFLANPNFINVDKKFLNNEHRMKLLKKKLEGLIEKNTIICLQEVGNYQLPFLNKFFYDYKFYCINVGELAIYFSWEIFMINLIDSGPIYKLTIPSLKKYNELIQSKNHKYIILSLIHKKTKKKITIVNTHLVSKVELNNLKLLQVYLILKKLDSYKNVIFCGDLNSVPSSDIVKLIINKKIKNDFIKLNIKNNYKSSHNFDLITTHTSNKYTKKFTEMIDYIFYQNNIKLHPPTFKMR